MNLSREQKVKLIEIIWSFEDHLLTSPDMGLEWLEKDDIAWDWIWDKLKDMKEELGWEDNYN